MPDLLEFEEPVGVLLKEIEALSLMPRTPERERSIETLRKRVPLTRETSGRAISIRSANSPIATITERKTAQRAIRRGGVAAVSEIEGITNWGAGPGFGPTANVNAPRTGWPSTEITRQYTRYQLSASLFSGTTSVSASADDRRGGPVVSWAPAAFVTDTIAKRGSTASL